MHDVILGNDRWLLGMKPLKFKRKVEEAKITYVCQGYGFSCALAVSSQVMSHSLCWYLVHNDKYRRLEQDHMMEVLGLIQKEAPDFAKEIFGRIRECAASGCMDTNVYSLSGQTKKSCSGRVEFSMLPEEFGQMRCFVTWVNRTMAE